MGPGLYWNRAICVKKAWINNLASRITLGYIYTYFLFRKTNGIKKTDTMFKFKILLKSEKITFFSCDNVDAQLLNNVLFSFSKAHWLSLLCISKVKHYLDKSFSRLTRLIGKLSTRHSVIRSCDSIRQLWHCSGPAYWHILYDSSKLIKLRKILRAFSDSAVDVLAIWSF